MREFPDPKKYIEERVQRAADRYADGLQHGGLLPSTRLERAVLNRTLRETTESYMAEMDETLEHNVKVIKRDTKRRLRQLRRKDRGWLIPLYLFVSLVFGVMTWWDYGHGDPGLWIIYGVGVLIFLAMALGVMFGLRG